MAHLSGGRLLLLERGLLDELLSRRVGLGGLSMVGISSVLALVLALGREEVRSLRGMRVRTAGSRATS